MSGNNTPNEYKFDTTSDFEEVATKIGDRYEASKEMPRDNAKVMCMLDGGDEWKRDFNRTPLVVYENGEAVNAAAVSKNDDYYTPVQFHEPLEALATAVRQNDDIQNISGDITIGKFSQRFTGHINFDGVDITDPTGNTVELGLRVKTAHNGFSAVRFDIGAKRLVCSNGLVAWDTEMSFSHAHDEGKFRDSMATAAVNAITDGTARAEERMEKAHEQRLNGKQEMFLLLLDTDIRWMFDDPRSALEEAFEQEVTWHDNPRRMRQEPSLYDAYMVGTHAIDHLADDGHSERAKSAARDRIKNLMESYDGSVPDADALVNDVVERRTDEMYADDGDGERWDGEAQIIQAVA